VESDHLHSPHFTAKRAPKIYAGNSSQTSFKHKSLVSLRKSSYDQKGLFYVKGSNPDSTFYQSSSDAMNKQRSLSKTKMRFTESQLGPMSNLKKVQKSKLISLERESNMSSANTSYLPDVQLNFNSTKAQGLQQQRLPTKPGSKFVHTEHQSFTP
jgi:hypothetical protein